MKMVHFTSLAVLEGIKRENSISMATLGAEVTVSCSAS